MTALGSPLTMVPSLTQELSFPLCETGPVQALWSGIQAAIEEGKKDTKELALLLGEHTHRKTEVM